ncbi:class I adenylate-forming enzyme family protein [Oceanibacterium hippocampi]|uniref:Long-chain-fatty-acid--CoA ligase n=1 Tax=Oceanibacterium hippocampi TaxID=745714 RepID=A0A1Y5TX33_9PROT|nr:AMP-binding protein [Oceanibacterium hippocampi]SLN72614.1 Long-chain-fatty-acid--CoA ligase [Oceanibacterium hippocampi]
MNPYIGLSYGLALDRVVATFGDREALVFEDRRLSFTEAREEIDRASARLGSLGLARGDKVSIWMPNRPEFIWYWLGAAQIGLVPVVLNTRLKLEEAAYQFEQSDSRAIIVPGDGAFHDFLGDVLTLCPELQDGPLGSDGASRLPKLRHVIAIDPSEKGASGVTHWPGPNDSALPVPPLETNPDAPGMIAYSSGTTALPKGAMLNHTGFRKAWDHGERFDQQADDRLFLAVPLFGILANVNGVLTCWSRGSCVVLERRFDPRRAIEVIERERCTFTYLFPIMIEQILNHPDYRPERTRSLRTGIISGTDGEVMRRVAEDLRMPGYLTSYGMTETSSAVTRTYWTDPDDIRRTTHGTPLPDIEVEIRDIANDAPLPAGQEGQICIRGYNIMIGYYNNPEANAAAFSDDGFFRTGDLGYMTPEGRMVFLRRIKDGYKHKGFNVSTSEVEKALAEHPDVSEAAVVGLPNRLAGEVGAAFVIAEPGRTIDPTDIRSFLKSRLATYKLPAHVFQVDEFPLTAGTGKIRKFQLRDMAIASLKAKADSRQ